MTNTHTRSVNRLQLFFALVLSITTLGASAQNIPTEAANIQAGKALFESNCKQCHAVDKKVIGPPLANVYDRAPSVAWIKSFVRNSSAVIASGDAYANKIYEENNHTLMTSFSSFKDEQIMDILAYIKNATDNPPAPPVPPPGKQDAQQGGGGIPSSYLNAIIIGMVLILVLILIVLIYLISSVKRFLDQKDLSEEDKEIVQSPYSAGSVVRSTGFIFVVVFIVAGLGFKAVINGLYSIGVQQGYEPKQPIAFSHKIHAGQYEIDCKYCHTGVLKGKNANIPSVNICMNCHNQIRTGTTTGEKQIAKVVEAFEKKEPIEWVRVHNLPDLAYFNHAQHVNVGGVQCQTCHGPIEEMDVVRQHSLLTMGWCIDCHRKTAVDTTGNQYYSKLVGLHKMKNGKAPFRVEDIGGLECSKCHY
jgi:mono/diheme cytochrome c family protein/Na+-transporting methylmalonyl-CoA/oxaloacetate decarboxylase gamma subunit